MSAEAWSYDAATRRVRDENGLTVAENVKAEDAAEITAAPSLWALAVEMLEYEAEAFDANEAVDYADVAAFFGRMRARLRAAVGPEPEEHPGHAISCSVFDGGRCSCGHSS